MGLDIFILVVFQVLAVFNRPYLPPPPNPEREYEEMEVGTANEKSTKSPGKYKICITWEILHRIFGSANMGYRYYTQSQ